MVSGVQKKSLGFQIAMQTVLEGDTDSPDPGGAGTDALHSWVGCLKNPHRNWEIHRGRFLGAVGHLKGSEVLLGSPKLRAVPAH